MFRKFQDSKYTQISIYILVVSCLIIAFYAFVDNIPYFFHLVIEKIAWIIKASKPLIIAIVFAYLLDPVVGFFERLYGKIKFIKGKPVCRVCAAITVAIIILAAVSTAISILIFSITDNFHFAKFSDLLVIIENYRDSINSLYNTAIKWLNTVDIKSEAVEKYVQEAAKSAFDYFKTGAGAFASSIGSIASIVTTSVIAIVMTIYLMIDGRMIMKVTDKVTRAIASDKIYRNLRSLVNDADTVFSGYIRGQFSDAFVMMVMICIVLSILNVKFAIIIGIFAGLGNLIPYVGPFVAYGGTLLVSLFTGEWKTCIIAIICLFVIQTIDGNIIGPKLLSNSIKIHPLLVIIFIVFGSAIGGLLGMLLAVPVGALIKVLFMKYIDRKIDSKEVKKSHQATVELPVDAKGNS